MIIVQYKAEATCLTVFKLEASVRGMTEQDGSPEIDENRRQRKEHSTNYGEELNGGYPWCDSEVNGG